MKIITGLYKIQIKPYVFEAIWVVLVLAVSQSSLSTVHECLPSIHLVFFFVYQK